MQYFGTFHTLNVKNLSLQTNILIWQLEHRIITARVFFKYCTLNSKQCQTWPTCLVSHNLWRLHREQRPIILAGQWECSLVWHRQLCHPDTGHINISQGSYFHIQVDTGGGDSNIEEASYYPETLLSMILFMRLTFQYLFEIQFVCMNVSVAQSRLSSCSASHITSQHDNGSEQWNVTRPSQLSCVRHKSQVSGHLVVTLLGVPFISNVESHPYKLVTG